MRILPRSWLVRFLLASGLGGTAVIVALFGFLLFGVMLFSGSGSLSQAPAASSYQPPAVISKSSGATDAQEFFAGALASCQPGLDGAVALGWALAEGGGVNPGQPPNNFLFLTAATGGFRSFASPLDAAQAVCVTLQAPDYTVIRASLGRPAVEQLIAIAESPWDGGHVAWGDPSGHYGGTGQNLIAAYYRATGSTGCYPSRGPC